jgi:Arc/MetJ family transcription regulator
MNLMPQDDVSDAGGHMRTTLTIDDELFAQALALAEPGVERADLLRQCVKTYVEVQAARRLAALGGRAPEIEPAPRRREPGPDA